MKHLLLLLAFVPVICLGQTDNGITMTIDSAGNTMFTFDSTKVCKGSIGYSLPPQLVGEHLPNCWHRQYCEREARANAARMMPATSEEWDVGVKNFGVAPQIGDTWRIADTIYTVNRNNEIEKYVRVKDFCEHIWVEEWHHPDIIPFQSSVVCVKCYKQETRRYFSDSISYEYLTVPDSTSTP